jgi:acid phosphatase family membrane protein YuiD
MRDYLILLVPAMGWMVAQVLKYVFETHKDGFQLRDFYSSGGFPSSHASSTVSLAVYIGATSGWSSNIFALASLMAAVVMYDSLGVRRTVQEHTKMLQRLSEKQNLSFTVRNASTGRGHTPKEVLGGLVVGLIVGLVCAAIF